MLRPFASALVLATLLACGQSTPQPEAPATASTASAGSAATVASADVTVAPPTSAATVATSDAPTDAAGQGTGATVSGPPSGWHDGGKGKPPSIRQGVIAVNGRLPPEVIQRILRTHFGVFRKCYEAALQRAPKTEGRVAVKFVIGRDGKVSGAADGGSDVGDAQMIACIVDDVAKLNFPQPEGGIVTVVYPIVFQKPQ
jgi:hypothetical protein